MDSYILTYSDFLNEAYEKYKEKIFPDENVDIFTSSGEDTVPNIIYERLKTIAAALVIIGAIGGSLATLQGLLATIWQEKDWEKKNNPNYEAPNPKNFLGKLYKKHKLKFILGAIASAVTLGIFGVYKLFKTLKVPPKKDEFGFNLNNIKNNESSSNIDVAAESIMKLSNSINGSSIMKKFDNDGFFNKKIEKISRATSINDNIKNDAVELQNYIQTKLNPKEIDILTKIGETLPF